MWNITHTGVPTYDRRGKILEWVALAIIKQDQDSATVTIYTIGEGNLSDECTAFPCLEKVWRTELGRSDVTERSNVSGNSRIAELPFTVGKQMPRGRRRGAHEQEAERGGLVAHNKWRQRGVWLAASSQHRGSLAFFPARLSQISWRRSQESYVAKHCIFGHLDPFSEVRCVVLNLAVWKFWTVFPPKKEKTFLFFQNKFPFFFFSGFASLVLP